MAIMKQPPSREYQNNYDAIFGKKDRLTEIQELTSELTKVTEETNKLLNKPRMLSQIERADLREDLRLTVEIARNTKV